MRLFRHTAEGSLLIIQRAGGGTAVARGLLIAFIQTAPLLTNPIKRLWLPVMRLPGIYETR